MASGISSNMLPFTPREQQVQDQIDAFNALSHDEIVDKYGDYREEYQPTFKDSVFGGNLDHARKEWRRGEWRKFYALEAGHYALCFGKTLAALPAKIITTVQNSCGKDSPEKQELIARDIQDLKDAARFIFLGAIYTVGKTALILLDPLVFLYRFIDQKILRPGPRDALLIIDTQYDFCEANDNLEIDGQTYNYAGGPLGVKGSWDIVPIIANLQRAIAKRGTIVACQDTHPLNHGATYKMLGGEAIGMYQLNGQPHMGWPVHCVEGSRGWRFVPGIIMNLISRVFQKGMNPRVDSYSAFYDNDHKSKTELAEYLKAHGITNVYVAGLAFDYCVGSSAKDALLEGFNVTVITDATKSVALETAEKMREDLEELEGPSGLKIQFTTSKKLMRDRSSPFFTEQV